MRIQYTFEVDGIVGQETCETGSRSIHDAVWRHLSDSLTDAGVGPFDGCNCDVLDARRIPVAGWNALLGGCAFTLAISARVNAFVLVLPDGGYKWSLVGDDEETCERATLASGTRDTLEAAQLAAEDAIVRMGQEFLRVGGGA